MFILAFLVFNSAALLVLPRRWAPLPLLIGASYVPIVQVLQLGPAHLSVTRVLIAIGFVRVMLRREWIAGRFNGLDWLILTWASWMLASSYLHADQGSALVYRLGLVFNSAGIYFLLRIFCTSVKDVVTLLRITAIVLVPLAVEMLYEKIARQNFFYGAVGFPITPEIRNGTIRSQGPFAHSILAGTVAATMLPLITALWNKHRMEAIMGMSASIVMTFACGSSGPLLSCIAGVFALAMWPHRSKTRPLLWMMIMGYLVLDLVMSAPAYYLMARIDLVGGSGGWHRARLIESSIEHLGEWWLGGTDYTRHWMPSGVSWSLEHTDITNHYIKMGVIGGVPLMMLFIVVLAKGFYFVGRATQVLPTSRRVMHDQFTCWAIGSSLFAHAVTFMSVTYFDQSFVFVCMTLGAIGSIYSCEVITSHA